MNTEVKTYLEKYPDEITALFTTLRGLILDSAETVEETMWAKIPSYYVGENFVRLILFKDHINVEAKAAVLHKAEMANYKWTPKGMVQIFVRQDVPFAVLKTIFSETLQGKE